jgi:endonuclease YncB( thermonuclease family)
MSSPYHKLITGTFVIVGKEPDGDSVRFIADDLEQLFELRNGHRIRPSKSDGSVQLRFEGVDAPELHYGNDAQPLGAEARDALLEWMGFSNIQLQGTRVTSADPADGIRGGILSKAAEANGRPVSWVFVGDAVPAGADGDWVRLTEAVLADTMNQKLLETGFAYYTVYTSTPLRRALRDLAKTARDNDAGVWAIDSTDEFVLEDQSSIDPSGALILPKLFRRATDFLKDVAKGAFDGNLDEWLIWKSRGSRSENDKVVLPNRTQVPLSALIDQRNRTIFFQAEILDIVFVEK